MTMFISFTFIFIYSFKESFFHIFFKKILFVSVVQDEGLLGLLTEKLGRCNAITVIGLAVASVASE